MDEDMDKTKKKVLHSLKGAKAKLCKRKRLYKIIEELYAKSVYFGLYNNLILCF